MPYNFKDIYTWDSPQFNFQSQRMNLIPSERPIYNNPYAGANNMNFTVLKTGSTNNPSSSTSSGVSSSGGDGGGFASGLNKAMAIGGGVMDIANTYLDLSSIADTSEQWNEIQDIRNIGHSNYYDFDELTQDYTRMADMPRSFDYRDIRGKSDGEMALGVGSSMVSGAIAGLQVGGPWGAAAGAAIGLGAGLAGVFSGNEKAKTEQRWLQDNAIMAEHSATANLNAGHEQLRDYQFRAGVSRRAAWGGRIERKKQSIRQFADNVLHKSRSNDVNHSAGIIRTHCNGGTMIRIKR